MALPATIRVNAQANFPTLVVGSGPITVTKLNGVWTIGFSILPFQTQTPPPASYPTDYILGYDSQTGTYFKISLSTLVGAISSGTWTIVNTATYTVQPLDRFLWVTANPCTITWPLSSTLTDNEVLVKDGAGGAGANNIHNVPSGAETIDGSLDRKITVNNGLLRIKRKPTLNGYAITG